MKHLLFILIFGIVPIKAFSLEEAFPTQNSIYIDLKKDAEKWEGIEVAFEGKITNFTESGKNRPYFKIEMPHPVNEELWSALLFDLGTGGGILIGDVVRVFGYYRPFQSSITSVGLNKTGYHLLTFCLVNLSTKRSYYMPHAMGQCEEWQDGELPKT